MSGLARSLLPALFLVGASTSALAFDPPITATIATPTMAPATTVSPATVTAGPADKVVCKMETPVGSRLGGHRTCMKKSDWDAQSLAARNMRDFAPPAGISGAH